MAIKEIKVPDLEGGENVAIVEVYVSKGEEIEFDTPLISLESDKAVLDVPSPFAGTITEMKVSEGDEINTGDVIALVEVSGGSEAEPKPEESDKKDDPGVKADSPEVKAEAEAKPEDASDGNTPDVAAKSEDAGTASKKPSTDETPVNKQTMGAKSHATPSLRAFARELGVDLGSIEGTGPKGRILREDVSSVVKKVMSSGVTSSANSGAAFSLPPIPTADFSQFGETKTEKLGRIKKISGPHLHRNWVGIPHVTQFEDADITEMEAFRKSLNLENAKTGLKLSPLIFIIKATINALKKFPNFNSSLSPDGSSLIIKKYYHIGIAVDTPEGLTVPVIKNADTKGIYEIAEELSDLSSRARDGKLKIDEMQGAGFSISSLGGIGGTYFTPIVNAPEVAILGLSRSLMKPVWNGEAFEPRLILPFSVSYDHRAVDGAEGARFAVYLASVLSDMRRILL